MKILIYGHKGWIGGLFTQILKDEMEKYERSEGENNNSEKKATLEYVLGQARVNNVCQVRQEIKDTQPTHIISFIGRTHGTDENGKKWTTIDYLEQPGKLVDNVRDNLFSPLVLSLIAKENNIHYTYLGTGCIFEFTEEHKKRWYEECLGFTESSLPNFFGSGYSVVKGFTDQLVNLEEFSKHVLNLRIRMPITGKVNARNFITKITRYEKICNMPNSMTVLDEMLPLVLDMMKQGRVGCLNLCNPGMIDHSTILGHYRNIVDPTFNWKIFSIAEQDKILASKRSNNFLDTSKLEEWYPDVMRIETSVKNVLASYKNDWDTLPEEEKYWKDYHLNNNNINNSNNNSINDFPDDKNTRLLVTGGCGFIGSNFINYILGKYTDIQLVNLDALYYCGKEENVAGEWRQSSRYKFIKCNLVDKNLLQYIINTEKPTHIIHFAAQSHVDNSFEDSLQFTQDNIVGTHTLLEVCRKYNKECENNKEIKTTIQKIIHVSTDEVYGESMLDVDEQQKTEHSILCPTNPYAATKAGAELIAQSYNHSFKMPIIISRGNNVYGPNQYPEKIIPRFINLLKNDEKLTIAGSGNQTRSFLHSYDTATAFECMLQRGKIGEIYNIGADVNDEYSVMDVAKLLIKLTKGENALSNFGDYVTFIDDRPFNDARYFISNDKLKGLGWVIKYYFEEGLKHLLGLSNKTSFNKISIV
jgi:dTDP-glucose 4,6-dehydratase